MKTILVTVRHENHLGKEVVCLVLLPKSNVGKCPEVLS